MSASKLPLLALFALLAACGEPQRTGEPAAASSRSAAAEALIEEAETWTARMSAEPPAADRERVETLVADVRGSLARAKSAVSDRERAAAYLRQDLDAAIAAIDPERRAVETAAGETLEAFDAEIAAFRVEVSSFGVQSNGEVRRRLLSLERGRKEAAATLSDLRKAEGELWGVLRRRFESQTAEWRSNHREAVERLPAVKSVPSPAVPAIAPEPRRTGPR